MRGGSDEGRGEDEERGEVWSEWEGGGEEGG